MITYTYRRKYLRIMYKYNVSVQSANNINFENNLEVYIVTSNAYYNIIIVAAAVCILSAMMIPRSRLRRRRVEHGRYSVPICVTVNDDYQFSILNTRSKSNKRENCEIPIKMCRFRNGPFCCSRLWTMSRETTV